MAVVSTISPLQILSTIDRTVIPCSVADPQTGLQHNLGSNVGSLFFPGEATSRKYFGFLYGAYFEGLDVATIMANCIKEGSCADMEYFSKINTALPFENNWNASGFL
ncbi:hypothetical protein CVT25_004752 [Psilocybe cyanescens]|uniref:Amine oxidase domain-containing protein n=1 Tax=Psilocybe cyanescens TaxID=93625 RepID=A0A409VSU0_PSICY|nr:hypothetical protein CVT25_004752 [Psilocybe cyanescens]